jgi:inosine/xanthosine triphosphatase
MAASLERALAGEAARVGTENPAKLSAVRAALAAFAAAPEVLAIVGVNVASGVSEQPIGWPEIIAGARNRARAALSSGPGALGFGIEDGLVELPVGVCAAGEASDRPAVFNVGCAWVTDGSRDGTGFSAGFAYPAGCQGPAFHDQVPIGALFDRLWQAQRGPSDAIAAGPSGRQGGNIGQLTQGRLDRSGYGTQAILCALVPFLHVDLYD